MGGATLRMAHTILGKNPYLFRLKHISRSMGNLNQDQWLSIKISMDWKKVRKIGNRKMYWSHLWEWKSSNDVRMMSSTYGYPPGDGYCHSIPGIRLIGWYWLYIIYKYIYMIYIYIIYIYIYIIYMILIVYHIMRCLNLVWLCTIVRYCSKTRG